MKKVGIYKIINIIDNKVYIGQTVNYNKRMKSHLSHLKNGKHHNEHLQRSFNKYGENSFKIELICECDISELDKLEKRYIKEYECTNPEHGYNMMHGGQQYRTFTPEVKAKMSKAMKGRKFTEEHKKRIGLSNRGKVIPKESIDKAKKTRKLRKVHRGEKNPNALVSNDVAKKIIIDLINGEKVRDISDKYGTSNDTVYNIMYNKTYQDAMPEVREELKNRTFINEKAKIDMAIELYLSGISQNKIASELNISRNTLRRELKKRNIDTQLYTNQYIKHTNTEVSNQITKG